MVVVRGIGYILGTIVLGNFDNLNGNFTRSRHTQQICLNRKRPDVMFPTGVYTCEVPDGSNTAMTYTVTITLQLYNVEGYKIS